MAYEQDEDREYIFSDSKDEEEYEETGFSFDQVERDVDGRTYYDEDVAEAHAVQEETVAVGCKSKLFSSYFDFTSTDFFFPG